MVSSPFKMHGVCTLLVWTLYMDKNALEKQSKGNIETSKHFSKSFFCSSSSFSSCPLDPMENVHYLPGLIDGSVPLFTLDFNSKVKSSIKV